MIDVAIIGGGPAALTAALYLARAEVKSCVYERKGFGGTLAEIAKISNYPGFVGPGPDLAHNMRSQAESAGALFAYGECTSVELVDGHFVLDIDAEPVAARSVIVATGSEPRRLDFDVPAPTSDSLSASAPTPASPLASSPALVSLSTPVSYCALCDGDLVRGQNVVVIGGANSAVQEAYYLAKLAAHVTLVSHSPLKADQVLRKQFSSLPNVDIIENLEPTADFVNQFDHAFVFIGRRPATSFLESLNQKIPQLLDESGYVNTGLSDYASATAVPGLFACGDVCSGATRQVISACGAGATAAIDAGMWLSTLGRESKLK